MNISEWLKNASVALVGARIATAKLDAEILLAHTLRKSRTFLHAHGDEVISPRNQEIADARLQLRCDRTPIAYIIGHKEFYGRLFSVTPSTLIPRPESETIIELLHAIVPQNQSLFPETIRLVDVGTGSGCLGITAKLEFPDLDVTLLDTSRHALRVAEKNARKLAADVSLETSDLLTKYPFQPHIIVANLPYVDAEWERSPETDYEPADALFAREHGLYLIRVLIEQSRAKIQPGGAILLEADPRQHSAIKRMADENGFSVRTIRGFVVHLERH